MFDTAASLSTNGAGWCVPVHGRVYRPASGRAAKAALALALKTGFGVAPDTGSRSVFDARCALLLGDNSPGKRIVVTIAGHDYVLPPSGRDGQFRTEVAVPLQQATVDGCSGFLPIEARLLDDDGQRVAGRAHLIAKTGISVISDIDDTVKVTHVGDRRRMMAMTFLEAFEAVDGMAARYRRWAEQGAVFHFISSSPWPLYEPLTDFLAQSGFPAATHTLKNVGLKDRSIRHFLSKSTKTKPPAIAAILASFPHRRFILVGDSAERDAEIYADIARRNPGRIAAIFIRNVSHGRKQRERMVRAFDGVGLDGVRCEIFADAADLPEVL